MTSGRWFLRTLAVLLLAATCVGCLAAQNVAIDTVAARQLAGSWILMVKAPEKFARGIGCGFAHYEGQLVVLDSVPIIVPAAPDSSACLGTGANAAFGFIVADESDQDRVLDVMEQALVRRPDLTLVGEIHGAVPVPAPDQSGRRIVAALVWAAWRPAPPQTSRA